MFNGKLDFGVDGLHDINGAEKDIAEKMTKMKNIIQKGLG